MDAGRITALAGATVGVVGIPLWAVGGRKVKVQEPRAQITAGPGNAALTLRF